MIKRLRERLARWCILSTALEASKDIPPGAYAVANSGPWVVLCADPGIMLDHAGALELASKILEAADRSPCNCPPGVERLSLSHLQDYPEGH